MALDGDEHDIYLMSNAMFSLEAEEFLRPPARLHATINVHESLKHASASFTVHNVSLNHASAASTVHNESLNHASESSTVHNESLNHASESFTVHNESLNHASESFTVHNATANGATPAVQEEEESGASQATMDPFYERTIGLNEVFSIDEDSHDTDMYPFWRKTVRYTGEPRFRMTSNASRGPPNVLLINVESFRSREVGVLGGRAKKAEFNQTVTPFFDQLSTTGVLFRQHYTPCVQTSRTILSTLFGILPVLKETSAVATYPTTKLRLHGLPLILKQTLNYSTYFWSAVDLGWEDWKGFLPAHGVDVLVDETSAIDLLTQEQRNALRFDEHFSWGHHDSVSFNALENFLEALHKNQSEEKKPWFMDMYTISSHDPFDLPGNFKPSTNYSVYLTEDNTKYLNALNYVDQCFERFITNLRSKGLLENTVVFIEGDHGVGRNEHGNNPGAVSSYVYDEVSHLPMLMLADDLLVAQDKGLVVDEVTSQTDLLATITDIVGAQNFMQHGVGQSMMRKRRKDASERAVVLENPYDGKTRGLRVGRDLKYARYGSGRYEVFNLTSDPWEKAAVETGKLSKNNDGGFDVGEDVNNVTADALRFMEQVVDVFEFMHEFNGYMPPPQKTTVKTHDPPSTPQAVSEPASETTLGPSMEEAMGFLEPETTLQPLMKEAMDFLEPETTLQPLMKEAMDFQ